MSQWSVSQIQLKSYYKPGRRIDWKIVITKITLNSEGIRTEKEEKAKKEKLKI